MKKHLSAVKTPLGPLVVGVAGLLLLLFTAYGLTRLASRGEVMGRVEVAGTQIGGLDEEQALGTFWRSRRRSTWAGQPSSTSRASS